MPLNVNELDALQPNEYVVVLTPDAEDGGFIAVCPTLDGCISDGETKEEALANIREAISASLDNQPAPAGVIVTKVTVDG